MASPGDAECQFASILDPDGLRGKEGNIDSGGSGGDSHLAQRPTAVTTGGLDPLLPEAYQYVELDQYLYLIRVMRTRRL